MPIQPLSKSAAAIIYEINNEAKPIHEIAEECLIPQGVEIPKPETIFSLEDIPLFTKKSISTLIGKAKSGKTTCTAWVVAKTIQMFMTVLWIDTEQGEYYGSRTQFWILRIAQMQSSDYLFYYDLRKKDTKTRGEIVRHLISEKKADLVVLDGVRDLVFDINNPEEATNLSGELMAMADINDCHILSILHQNKGNEHARGHLGTEMINKSETVIQVSNNEDITICEPVFTRGKPFMPFSFYRDDHGIPQIMENTSVTSNGESNAKKLLPVQIDPKTHHRILQTVFGTGTQTKDAKMFGTGSLCYGEFISGLQAAFEQYGNSMGISKVKSFIAFYVQNGYIIKENINSNKTYYKYLNE